MESVIRKVVEIVEAGDRAALVTPLETEGSLPAGRDARMAILEDGTTWGTVGGGRMEADVARVGPDVLANDRPQLLHISLSARDAEEDGHLCGGEVTFLIEPVSAGEGVDSLREILRLRERRAVGIEAVRVLNGEPVQRMVVSEGGRCVGTLGRPDIDKAVVDQSPDLSAAGIRKVIDVDPDGVPARVIVNPIQPYPTVYVFGAGHVGLAVCQVAPSAGFQVVVVDDRPEFANRLRFPNAELVLVRDFGTALSSLPVHEDAFVVVVGQVPNLVETRRAPRTVLML